MDGTECQILLDTGTSKSHMSKSYYLRCKSLHVLPKFASDTQRIQVGNGQYVGVLFVIPVIVDVHDHRFEIFTLVSEIHENVGLVLGIKNIFELEGVIDSHDSCFSFLNRSIPFFPKEKDRNQIKRAKVSHSRSTICRGNIRNGNSEGIRYARASYTHDKLKFIRNSATLKITNNTHETVTFDLTEMTGILDLRSLGYY